MNKWPADSVQMLGECDLSDLENVFSESDEFIPPPDMSESER
jgi:hypothetical protein